MEKRIIFQTQSITDKINGEKKSIGLKNNRMKLELARSARGKCKLRSRKGLDNPSQGAMKALS